VTPPHDRTSTESWRGLSQFSSRTSPETGTGESISHTYYGTGTKTVTLTVVDPMEMSGSATATVTFYPARTRI